MIDGASVLEISLSDAHMNKGNGYGYDFCVANNSVFIFKSSSFTRNTGGGGLIGLQSSTGHLENCTLIGSKKKMLELFSFQHLS